MSLLLGLALGVILSAVFPSVPAWVRGAWGRVSGAVMGSPPARAATLTETKPPAKPKVDWAKGAGNILAFFGKLIAWCVSNPIPAIAAVILIVLVVWRPFAPVVNFVKCPFGGAGILWCAQSRAELQEALKDERDNTRVAQLETQVAALSAQLAENSANDRRRVDRIVAQANEEIDNAVEAVDADQLYRVYRDAYERVWNDLSPAGEPNSAPRGSDQVRRADGSPI